MKLYINYISRYNCLRALWRSDCYQEGVLQSKTYHINCFSYQVLHSQVPGAVLMNLTELNCLYYLWQPSRFTLF